MRAGSLLTVAGAAAELEARFGSLLTAFPFDPQARFAPAGNQSESIMRKGAQRASDFAEMLAGGLLRRAVAVPVTADAELHRGCRIAPAEPNGETPPPAAHARNVDGKDEEPEGDHPEAE